MNVDLKAIEGKIKALEPGFELMAEMTGRAATPTVMGFHVDHYVACHLSMDTVNRAIASVMTNWGKGYWPYPEVIAARAQEIARQERYASLSTQDRAAEMEEAFQRAGARQWEHRVSLANDWREANPDRFRTEVMPKVDAAVKERLRRVASMREHKPYRQSFRDGVVVGRCIRLAAFDEAKARRLAERERMRRAKQDAGSEVVEDAA